MVAVENLELPQVVMVVMVVMNVMVVYQNCHQLVMVDLEDLQLQQLYPELSTELD